MKKITAIILMLTMLLQMTPFIGLAAEAEGYESAIATIEALGIMNGYPDGSFQPELNVTRVEFASVISKLLGYSPDDSKGEATPFYDVTASHWASPYVNIVNNHGLMSGYGEGLFLPENNITLNEVVKVMIVLMGYGYFAEVKGGYPTGYYLQANELNILDGIKSEGSSLITRGELAQILCESFDVDIYLPDGYGADVSIRKEKDVSILSKYLDIYDTEGVVTATKFTSVTGDEPTNDGKVEIDGKKYHVDLDGVEAYLGYNVKVYYHQEESGKRTVLYLEPRDNNIVTISADSFNDANGYKLTYYTESGKKKTIELESNTNIIINNEFINRAVNYNLNSLSLINGTITFISNDGDNKYDAVIAKDYTVGVVEGVDVNGERISFQFGASGVTLADKPYVIHKDGEEVGLSKIKKSDVLLILASRSFLAGESGGVIEMMICDTTVNGTVASVSGNEIFISTKEGKSKYEISPAYISEKGTTPDIDDNGVFYIDNSGKIITCLQSSSGGMQFGYLIDAALEENLITTVYVKLLTAAGEIKVVKAKDKVRMDGESVTAKEMYTNLMSMSETSKPSMIIRYVINENDLLSAIDTVAENTNGDPTALTVITESERMRFQDKSKMLTCSSPQRYIIDDGVRVFEIPGDVDDEYGYGVYGNSYFQAFEYYGGSESGKTMTFCNVKGGVPAAVFMMGGTASASTQLGTILLSENPTGVIKEKYYALDDDGMDGIKIIVESRDSEIELFVTDDTKFFFTNGEQVVSDKLPGAEDKLTVDDFNFGDVIMWDVGSRNKANVLLRINDTDVSKLKTGEYQVTGLSGYTEFIMGSVRHKNGTIMELDVSTSPDLYINSRDNGTVHIVDMRTRKVTKATLDDIWASESDLDADKLFVRIRFGSVKEIYIYR